MSANTAGALTYEHYDSVRVHTIDMWNWTTNFTSGYILDPNTSSDANLINNQSSPSYNTYSDHEAKLKFQYYALGIAGNVISCLGILGNILSIAVLSNKKMRSSTSIYLIAQAVFDCIVLISLVMFIALPTLTYGVKSMRTYKDFYPYMHPVAYPTALTAQTCSIYTTVAFTVERYIAVVKPLQASKMCTVKRARKVVVALVLLSMIYNIPRMLESRVEMYTPPGTNKTIPINVYTALALNQTFRNVYFIYTHMFVMVLIPVLVLAILNWFLIRAVRKSEQATGRVSTRARKENNLTVMLIAVVVVFLVCQLPSIADNIFYAIKNAKDLQGLNFVILTGVSSLMVITNSAVNFYLYCCFGRKFRQVFVKIFCQCSFLLKTKILHSDTSFAFRSTMRKKHSHKKTSQRSNNCRAGSPVEHNDNGAMMLTENPPHYNTLVKELPNSNGTVIVSKYTHLGKTPSTQL